MSPKILVAPGLREYRARPRWLEDSTEEGALGDLDNDPLLDACTPSAAVWPCFHGSRGLHKSLCTGPGELLLVQWNSDDVTY